MYRILGHPNFVSALALRCIYCLLWYIAKFAGRLLNQGGSFTVQIRKNLSFFFADAPKNWEDEFTLLTFFRVKIMFCGDVYYIWWRNNKTKSYLYIEQISLFSMRIACFSSFFMSDCKLFLTLLQVLLQGEVDKLTCIVLWNPSFLPDSISTLFWHENDLIIPCISP